MLKIGDQAPYFEGTDQNGEIIRLSDFKGRKLVLYFYPKDSTPGCTAEACDLRDPGLTSEIHCKILPPFPSHLRPGHRHSSGL